MKGFFCKKGTNLKPNDSNLTASPFHSDLAKERRGASRTVRGMNYAEQTMEGYSVERLHVTHEDAARAIDRPLGHYNTVSTRPFHSLSKPESQRVKDALSKELREICRPYLLSTGRLLVVGLGNRHIVADSIGARTVEKVRQTATIRREAIGLFESLGCMEIRTLCPGVEGETGTEAASLVRALLGIWRADLIVAVDALATQSTERLCATFQLSDTGIFPGSGLGLRKEALNEENLGVPVVAVGVPTVQSSHAYFLEEAKRQGLTQATPPKDPPVFFCPNTLEEDVAIAAEILGGAINHTFGIEPPDE